MICLLIHILAGALFWIALWLSAGRVPSTLSLALIVLALVLFILPAALPARQAVRA